ncbi:glycosyltransferase [Patulibacter minatonensis]|uniref:glycosyltransferase n=1 Tax=Patulibacter minatonensis TaxID=298163 RepID=UPI0006869A5B|nr:glycosyltransferase [Patulibacter minatonensis]
MTVRISVVVPYFEHQRRLDLLLEALELQTVGPAAFEVVIADDGSSTPPDVGRHPYAVRVVRQADLGVRPAAARNLGVRATNGAMLAFLDGDMVPEPGYLAAMERSCDGRHLVVGRRRHADLSGTAPDALAPWFRSGAGGPPVLPEPEWLARGYRESRDLADADLRSYRFVIGATLACPRELVLRTGGFAEEVVGYGGEDWEFARRCWLAGADLRHAPDAVAWHDGPDLALREGDQLTVKNAETVLIAPLLTDPQLRGRGLVWPHPRVVVRIRDGACSAAELVACASGFLAGGDVGVWIGGASAPGLSDPRVRSGLPGAGTLGRCELVIDVLAPVAVDADRIAALQDAAPTGNAQLEARSPRDVALGRPTSELPPVPTLPDGLQLEAWFAR